MKLFVRGSDKGLCLQTVAQVDTTAFHYNNYAI